MRSAASSGRRSLRSRGLLCDARPAATSTPGRRRSRTSRLGVRWRHVSPKPRRTSAPASSWSGRRRRPTVRRKEPRHILGLIKIAATTEADRLRKEKAALREQAASLHEEAVALGAGQRRIVQPPPLSTRRRVAGRRAPGCRKICHLAANEYEPSGGGASLEGLRQEAIESATPAADELRKRSGVGSRDALLARVGAKKNWESSMLHTAPVLSKAPTEMGTSQMHNQRYYSLAGVGARNMFDRMPHSFTTFLLWFFIRSANAFVDTLLEDKFRQKECFSKFGIPFTLLCSGSSHFRIVMPPITYVAAASAASEMGDRGLAVAALARRSCRV